VGKIIPLSKVLLMQKYITLVGCILWSVLVHAQGVLPVNQEGNQANIGSARDIQVTLEGEKPPISDYLQIAHDGTITHADTSLTIQKNYRYNYLRKDDYYLMPFANVGQTYNTLAYDFNEYHLRPRLGARARHFNYMEIEDLYYYHVPTPLTELYFKTAFEQGQQLDAFLTLNTTEQLNFSIAYKGVRSLGNYRHTLTSTGNFRFTTRYQSPNKRYQLRAHITFQDLMNQENGGLKPAFVDYFKQDHPEFTDRARLEVHLADAENILQGKRFYLAQDYALVNQKDSLSHWQFSLGNITTFEDKNYRYSNKTPFAGFGPSYVAEGIHDKVTLEDFYTQLYTDIDHSLWGKFRLGLGYNYTNYGYSSLVILDDQLIQNRLVGHTVDFSGAYHKNYRGFELSGKVGTHVAGDWEGSYLQAQAAYQLNPENRVQASVMLHSVQPDYNFLLYQSDYENYNWQNTHFDNVFKQHLQFDLQSKKWFDATVRYTGIENYTYFAHQADSLTRPYQYGDRINYLLVEAHREFTWGKFSWDNRLTYQQVISGEEVFKVPQVLARSSLYFSDHFFDKALFLQTGISGKYFTQYEMLAYDPVLAEFYVQNHEKIGDFPLLDLFINAKISQTRIYVKWEHFNSLFSPNNYFSAPGHPYRDWKIRFGLVWNFFM
jgi:hypothetical protein